ncbi:MAG TPA: radical SAM protein, partial [Thermoplasmatales archaeon]|nr:radical SAM protein [Thermoplasmatales archaeon]
MYDPLKLAEKTEKIVVNDNRRKYHRFRATHFYSGSATADAVGCNLRCVFCWADKPVREPHRMGRFYTPQEIAERLVNIASRERFRLVRISGAEPTIGRRHLLSLLGTLEDYPLTFILETNGILIGYDKNFACELSSFKNLHVRVSLKGCSEDEFRW